MRILFFPLFFTHSRLVPSESVHAVAVADAGSAAALRKEQRTEAEEAKEEEEEEEEEDEEEEEEARGEISGLFAARGRGTRKYWPFFCPLMKGGEPGNFRSACNESSGVAVSTGELRRGREVQGLNGGKFSS